MFLTLGAQMVSERPQGGYDIATFADSHDAEP